MTKKELKKAILGHFRPKNALIDLKIDNIMYLCVFHRFLNFCSKILKNGQFLAKKTFFGQKLVNF